MSEYQVPLALAREIAATVYERVRDVFEAYEAQGEEGSNACGMQMEQAASAVLDAYRVEQVGPGAYAYK